MANRLAQEQSPYLLQHAANPVDWYPWGAEALRVAREAGKPILLSIGYSACHWCHVMAHESFEDEDTAALMNALFVNIKVDREERPDLDQIYQTAHQLMTQKSGGWPLTMFLTPEGVPFLGGTYFPKTQRYGLPSFRDLLQYVSEAFVKQAEDVAKQGEAILAGLARTLPTDAAHEGEFSSGVIRAAVISLDASFDSRYGGFGGAPKFPHPTDLNLLLRAYARDEAPRSRAIVLTTLNRMAAGGIFDQLGGGFYRYSVDAEWNVPHFEKMLYDNGPLLQLYADAFALTQDAQYQRVAEQTAGWVMREMQASAGGYYAALDADSEGEEGRFYVWTPSEVQAALTAEEYAVVARHYSLNRSANFEATHWHLYVAEPLWQIANSLKIDNATGEALLDSARAKLRSLRDQRVRPAVDDKILTASNALMIAGMARAAAVFGRPEWLASARRALDFIRHVVWTDGRLRVGARGQQALGEGFLDDDAFLLCALLEVIQADFRNEDLQWACALADGLIAHFEDAQAGGFFFTSHDHEKLIHRTKPGLDHAVPAGNAMAALGLQRLGLLLGQPRYLEAATRCLRVYYPAMAGNPSGYSMMAIVLAEALAPPRSVVLRGPAAEVGAWRDKLNAAFAPDLITLAPGEQRGLPPALDKPVGAAVAAWVCTGTQCQPPLGDWAALEGALGLKYGAEI